MLRVGLLIVFLGWGWVELAWGEVSLVMIGDSTMAAKRENARPEMGWGEALSLFFDDTVVIENLAVNGRSSKSFIDEGRWAKALELLGEGDFLIVQFGHNDEKAHDPSRFTDPWGAYADNLRRFVRESREKGAQPILLTSICRRSFGEDGELRETHGEYPAAARAVAAEMGVPLIDMEKRTAELLTRLGPEGSRALFLHLEPGESENYPDGKRDDTHLNGLGARKHASLFAEGLKEIDSPLARRVSAEND